MIDSVLDQAFRCNPDLKTWVIQYCDDTGVELDDINVAEVVQALWDAFKELYKEVK